MNWEVRHGERRKPNKENTMNHNWQAGHEPDEIEALREKVAALAKERDTLNAALDAKITICGDANLAAMTEECNLGHTLYSQSLDDLAAMTKLWENEYRLRCEAQARIVELREHLALAVLYGPPMAIGNVLSKDVLALPQDSSALDELLEEAYSQGYDVGCADTTEDT